MIHAQLLRPDQLPALKRLHIDPSFFTTHLLLGRYPCKNFRTCQGGTDQPSKIRIRTRRSVRFSSGHPVISPICWRLSGAVNRITREGRQLGKRMYFHFSSTKAVTANAAFAILKEQEGNAHPRKRADLVVLDQNPLSCPPKELRSLRVLATIKDRTAVYRQK